MHFLFYFCIGYIFEGLAIYFSIKERVSTLNGLFFLMFFLHIVSVVVFSLGIYRGAIRFRFSSPKNWLVMSWCVGFVFPAVGFLAMTWFLLSLERQSEAVTDVYDEYEKYITYEYHPEKKYTVADKIIESVGDELEVSPLVDVMGEGDVKLRRGVVDIMDQLPRKDGIRLLRVSLADYNPEIRFHAAVRLSEIEAELNDNILMAQKEVERNGISADTHLALANSYAEYYESGILDLTTAQYYRELAFKEYCRVLKIGGEDNARVLCAIGNLSIEKKEYKEALSNFRKASKLDPSDIYAIVGVIQSYYEQGTIDQVIEYAKDIIEKMPKASGPMKEIITYWAS